MAFTDAQIANYALQLQQKGAPSSDIESFVQQAKQEQLAAQQPQNGQTNDQQGASTDQINQQSSPPQSISPEQAGGKIASTVMGALNPANMEQNLGNLAQRAARVVRSPGAQNFYPDVPSEAQQQDAQQQQDQQTDQLAQTTQTLNELGIIPNSQDNLQKRIDTLNKVEAAVTPGGSLGVNINKAAAAGIQSIGQGAQEIGQGLKQGIENMGTDTGVQGSQKAFQGFEDIVKGGLGTALSPISGAINSIPQDQIKEGINALGNAPGWATSGIAKWAAKLANPSLSDDEVDKLVGQPVNLATQLFLTKEAPEKAGKLSEGIKEAMTKPDLSPTQIGLERAASKAGMSPTDIATMRNLSPEQTSTALEYLQTALKKQTNPSADIPSVWNKPGKEIEDFVNQAHGQLKVIGQNMDNAIQTDLKGKTVDASPINQTWNNVLDKMNVARDWKGNLDFSNSDIGANPKAISALKKIDKNLSNAPTTTNSLNDTMSGNPMDARNLVSINRMINDITGVSAKGGYNANALSASLSPLKDAVDQIASDNSSLYSTAKAEYAGLKQHLDAIENAGHYGSGKNQGFSGEQILKRSLTTSAEKYSGALDSIKNISENFGIDAPENIQAKAQLADLMERFSQTKPSRSLGGMMQQGGNSIAEKVVPATIPGQILRGVSGKLKDIGTDVNYQYFSGKIPGFKEAIDTASQNQVKSMFDLISKKDFNNLSPDTKFSVLKSVAKSVPDHILQKMVKTAAKSIINTEKRK